MLMTTASHGVSAPPSLSASLRRPPARLYGSGCRDHVGHGFGGAKLVAVNWISVIALRLRAP
jgi:hypothetical protein